MHSTPYPDPPTLSARPGPVLLPPRPRSTSVPPMSKTVQRMAKRYMPVTETITPPISPARASAMDPQADPDTPPPTQRPGRSRGRGKWCAPQSATPGVGTRSKTRQAELDAAEATLAQVSRAVWPEKPDRTAQIQRMTRDLQISDRLQDTFREIQNTGCLLHSTPTSWWWRCGGLNPCEHGNSRVDPPRGPISCGATTRGPSLFGRTHDAPQSLLHDEPDTHWYARPASIPSTVGRGNACPRRTVETII